VDHQADSRGPQVDNCCCKLFYIGW